MTINIVDKNKNININDDFEDLSIKLNNIFKNIENDITKFISVNSNNTIKPRNRILTFSDALSYYFSYSFIGTTKMSVISQYNFDNKINVHLSNFYRKELSIPLDIYVSLFNKIKTLFYSYSNDKKDIIKPVDGVYNNTNIKNDKTLETSLNLGIFDFNNRIPVDIQFKGQENKNKEISSFINYIENNNIKNNNIDNNNVIYVFDRAYFSYDFINYLDDKKIKYVIRSKNNSLYLNNKETNKNIKNNKYSDKSNVKKENIKKNNKNSNTSNVKKRIINKNIDSKINKLKKTIKNKNVRFISYEDKCIITKKNRDNKDVKLEKTIKCHIITNLDINEYNDDKIKKIYLARWSIEVFFKLLKSNFKFSNLKEHNKNTLNQYKKQYHIIMIQIYIVRLIELIYEKNYKKLDEPKFNKKNKNKYKVKYNDSLMIEGLKNITDHIIKSKINSKVLMSYSNNYIKVINVQTEIYNERKCNNPSCKWYIKSYAEYYKYMKVINALLNNKVDSLDKNLKILASELKIIK